MIKADFHMHTNYSPDSEVTPEQLVNRCLKVGLDCVAVTDHNTIDGALAVKKLAPFIVIIGEEIRSAQGEITGLFLTECIPAGLPPRDTVKLIKDQGGIVSIPHPFDRFRSEVISPAALESIADLADIVESFNARNTMSAANRKAQAYALDHGLLTSAVSDAHTTIELGRTYTEMPNFDGSPCDFKRALAEATLVGRKMNPLIHVVTSLTKIKKRLLGSRV